MDTFEPLAQHNESKLCPHFGTCGGCSLQDKKYEEQIRIKEKHLETLLTPHKLPPRSILSSPTIWGYRNRVDFNFGRRFYDTPPPKEFDRETVLGFRRKNRWFHLIDISNCLIAPSLTPTLLETVRCWARETGLKGYDSRTHQGTLKLLLVRESKRVNEKMVVLVTGEDVPRLEEFRDAVLTVYPATSIHHAVSNSRANVAFAETTTLLHGKPYISEQFHIPKVLGTRKILIRVTPFGFLQSNTFVAEILYSLVRNWVESFGFTRLYDLYGGNGAIGLACADLVEHIITVESMPDSITARRETAADNGVTHMDFVQAKVEDYLRDFYEKGNKFTSDDIVVVDPPRAGLHPKALKYLMDLAPDYLIYISCKPEVLSQQDLPVLLSQYKLIDMEALDMFPHTPHVELALLLGKRSEYDD